MKKLQRFAVIGAGAWGTALAVAVVRAGGEPLVWAHRAETAERINRERANPDYLPGVELPPPIAATHRLADFADREALIFAVPAQSLRSVAGALRGIPPARTPLVIGCKGIEQNTAKPMSKVLREALPKHPIAILSGPTFAAEVAAGLPTAATVASADPTLGRRLAASLGSARFRLYWSDDVVGVELGGAVKNVLAIACGIVVGRRLGENARAALIARGLAELLRLGSARGARPKTLMGLSGLGDLVLTCSSRQSRNFSLGVALGEGQRLEDYLAGRRTVAEGMYSASAVCRMAEDAGVEMPIAAAVDAVLNRGAAIDSMAETLLQRPLRSESA
jgi:glycerol-3-phosphate dehydrogenase (NAD(P)+)